MGRAPGRGRNGASGVGIRPSDLDQMSYRAGLGEVQSGHAPCQRAWESDANGMTRTALLVLMPTPVVGYRKEGPRGVAGAIITAPVTTLVMFVSARMGKAEGARRRSDRRAGNERVEAVAPA